MQYLLDTNILVHAVRGGDAWKNLQSQFELFIVEPTPFISVVTVGELRSLAYQWDWATVKRDQMEFLLGYFKALTIDDPSVIEAYAVIDSYFQARGHSLGKNDLWIASTAHVTGTTLLTEDKDFLPLEPQFLKLIRFDFSSSVLDIVGQPSED